ncbi:MAG: hypothetical protein WBZ04_10430 [Candidatus Nanopelagicales bacterium]
MLIETRDPLLLGRESEPALNFKQGDIDQGAWAGQRFLWIEDRPAFELSFWCGTCPFLFKRLEGASRTLSIPELADRLAVGIAGIDVEVVSAFADLLPSGLYQPLLTTIEPKLVFPMKPGDYFADEQVATWNVERFWGLPQYPQTPYYRTFETAVSDNAHLYEFVVPMVPPTWNVPTRVAAMANRLAHSGEPTAVAVSTLDVCRPAMNVGTRDFYQHWGLTHFVLDGHHKLQAAAELGLPLQLLSLLAIDFSLADLEQIHRIPELLDQPPATR